MTRLAYQLERMGRLFWVGTGIALFCIIGFLDYVTGTHFSLSLFYVLPIFAFAWGVKGSAGIYAAIISSVIWVWIDTMDTSRHISIFESLWNGVVRLGYFLLPVLMLRNLEKEIAYARTDFLTGAINSRYFRYLLEKEIERSNRYNHMFSMVFIDLDDFKAINDVFGHTVGDNVLRFVAETIKKNLRKTDFIARMGGDEFAILLPETDSKAVHSTMEHMKQTIHEEALRKKWPISFSIGALTTNGQNLTADEILRIVDKAMYQVKNTGKNDVKYVVR